jgi:PAS domain S-box-containing protein
MTDSFTPQTSALGDVTLDIAQSFYSRTDKRGVIQAGNSVFQAIAGFEWAQLLGAPHKIVRNADTPRAVFRVMWNLIQSGEIATAYVRNKTSDGRGYWVIAMVLPIEGGYISARIKPTSPIFDKIRPIYAALTAAEAGEGLSVEDSETRLLDELKTLGYANYHEFQKAAILAEFRNRSLALSPKMKSYFTDVDRIHAGLTTITAAQGELISAVESLRDLPTNMRIVASRQEPSGGPLSAMSDIYNSTSSLLFQEITEFALGKSSISKRMIEAFEHSCFIKVASLLMEEIVTNSAKEDLSEHNIDPTVEVAHLADALSHYSGQERAALQNAERLAQDLNRASYDLRRSMLGLDTIRVMGLVESGRLGAEGSRIGATMEQIGNCHNNIIALLQRIKDNATIVNAGVTGLRTHFQKRAALAAH